MAGPIAASEFTECTLLVLFWSHTPHFMGLLPCLIYISSNMSTWCDLNPVL